MYGLGWHGGHGHHGHHGGGWPGGGWGWNAPVEVVTVQSQTCPSLYVWDDATQACKLDLTSPPLLLGAGAMLVALVALGRR